MILQVERVTKSFPTPSGQLPRPVLEDFSLDLEDHGFLAVLGPSGCGKTTLLRLIAGFEVADAGRVVFDGQEVRGPSAERVVVFQQPGLYPWLNLRENVAFGLRLRHRRIDWSVVDEMIERVGLQDFAQHAPYQLSGGMQQRAALARSLVTRPKMLLMDEPFAALDAHLRRSMQTFLLELWRDVQTTVLFITHDVEEALVLADRVLVLGRSGRELEQLSAAEVVGGRELIDDHQYRTLRRRAEALLADAS